MQTRSADEPVRGELRWRPLDGWTADPCSALRRRQSRLPTSTTACLSSRLSSSPHPAQMTTFVTCLNCNNRCGGGLCPAAGCPVLLAPWCCCCADGAVTAARASCKPLPLSPPPSLPLAGGSSAEAGEPTRGSRCAAAGGGSSSCMTATARHELGLERCGLVTQHSCILERC